MVARSAIFQGVLLRPFASLRRAAFCAGVSTRGVGGVHMS
jgi:hypothetical protein